MAAEGRGAAHRVPVLDASGNLVKLITQGGIAKFILAVSKATPNLHPLPLHASLLARDVCGCSVVVVFFQFLRVPDF